MLFKWRQIDISSDWEDFQFRQLHLRSLLRDSHPERCSSCGCRKVGFPMFQVVGFDVSADPNTSEGTPQSVCHTFPLLICAEVLFWCFARCLTCLTCLISLLWGQSHRHDFLTVQSLRRWDLSQGDNPMVLRLEAWAIAPQLRWVSVSDTAVPAAGCWVGRGVGLYVLGLDCLLACSSFFSSFPENALFGSLWCVSVLLGDLLLHLSLVYRCGAVNCAGCAVYWRRWCSADSKVQVWKWKLTRTDKHTRTHRTQMFDAQRTQIAEALMHMGSFATIAKCSIFLSLQQLV